MQKNELCKVNWTVKDLPLIGEIGKRLLVGRPRRKHGGMLEIGNN